MWAAPGSSSLKLTYISAMQIQLIDIPKIEDYRGNIAVVEQNTIPFECKRVYYLYDIPSTARRGGHAHKEQQELLIAVSGSFDVILHDGKSSATVTLNKPDKGLLIPVNTWRELENFSSGAVCLVLNSDVFREEDYIREFEEFLAMNR
jgi:dTDP-4-dehydrorhamnose 3,5-epimerase-like enzyme